MRSFKEWWDDDDDSKTELWDLLTVACITIIASGVTYCVIVISEQVAG
jgi:hypothetical protein